MSPTSTIPTPPGVSGSAPRIRTSAHAANASITVTSDSVTPVTRRQTRSRTKTVRWPASVAIVMTCQRRRSSPSASRAEPDERLPSPLHRALAHDPQERGRRIRAARSPIRCAHSASREDERERRHGDDQHRHPDERGGAQRRVILVLRRQECERDDREGEIRRAGSRCPRSRPRDATAAGANFQDLSIEYDAAIPTAAPAGETIESAVDACVIAIASRKPEARERSHPRRREGREVEHDRSGEQQPVLPAEGAHDVEHVAVVRELREDEDEDDHDDDDRPRCAEESLVALRQSSPARRRAVRHREEPIVRPSSNARRGRSHAMNRAHVSRSRREPPSRSSRSSSPSAAPPSRWASASRARASRSSAARTAPSVASPRLRAIASQGIANFPDSFTSANNLFARKFNCTGKAVQARRVETGVFEVRFVGISGCERGRQRGGRTTLYATVRRRLGRLVPS